jgi:hypothetical protein
MLLDDNKDGYVDRYYAWGDTDGDGVFDQREYISFLNKDSSKNRTSNDQASTNQQNKQSGSSDAQSSRQTESNPQDNDWSKKKIAKTTTVTGSIQQIDQTQEAPNHSRNLVIQVSTQDGQKMRVDLGNAGSNIRDKIHQGKQITAKGAVVESDGQKVLVAQSAQVDGQELKIMRRHQQYSGTVKSQKKITIRGKEHILVMLQNGNSNNTIAIDLGPSEKLDVKLEEGSKLDIEGFPVLVQDRRMVLATAIQKDGKHHRIQRSEQSSDSRSKG